jgi:hypothetical protein
VVVFYNGYSFGIKNYSIYIIFFVTKAGCHFYEKINEIMVVISRRIAFSNKTIFHKISFYFLHISIKSVTVLVK